jgi:predicted DNA-binding transcriptional regulator
MAKIWGGTALLGLAAFMLLGFMRSDASLASPAAIAALLVTVVLPAAGGVALIANAHVRRAQVEQRRRQFRQQTLDAEVLRLAAARDGRLTQVEVVTELAISDDDARQTLKSLMTRGAADVEITEAGGLVYVFASVRQVGDKHTSRGILDG